MPLGGSAKTHVGREDRLAAHCAFLHKADAPVQSDHGAPSVQRPYAQAATGEYAPNHRSITNVRPRRRGACAGGAGRGKSDQAKKQVTVQPGHAVTRYQRSICPVGRGESPKMVGRVGVVTHAVCTAAPRAEDDMNDVAGVGTDFGKGGWATKPLS